jgi:hypothetical protein
MYVVLGISLLLVLIGFLCMAVINKSCNYYYTGSKVCENCELMKYGYCENIDVLKEKRSLGKI